jgi:hypothetical protein
LLTLLLGKTLGIAGILLATIIAGACTGLWYVPYTAMRFLQIKLSEYLKVILFPLCAISIIGLGLYWITTFVFQRIELSWFSFFVISSVLMSLFGIATWILFLKKELSHHIPQNIKKYLSFY